MAEMQLEQSWSERLIAELLESRPLKAAGFIVTVYGDVVEPRGGVVWIGNLIEACSEVGISETLVRTAVSRLVAAGQLIGEREGRRSFYRLSQAARSEFAAAAKLLFGGIEEASGWHFVYLAGSSPDEAFQALGRAGHARIAPRLTVGAHLPAEMPEATMVFRADDPRADGFLRSFADDYFDLAPHSAAYRAFIDRFGLLAERLDAGQRPMPAQCLTLRLLLVHEFRSVLLRDPRLPAAALPDDWPGATARRLFADLYCALSPHADRHVAANFVRATGPFDERNEATGLRLVTLDAKPRGEA